MGYPYFWKHPNVLGVYIGHPPDSRILKGGYVGSSLFHVPNSRCKDFHDMKYPLRIHGTGIFTYIWVIFKWLNVGKYTSPMDPSWGIPYLSTPHPVTLGASILRATPDPKYTGLSYTNEIHKEICKPFQPNPNKYVASWWLNQPL